MKKYRYEFREFNYISKDIVNEEQTLRVFADQYIHENDVTKEEKELLKDAEAWAKYAFKNNKEYVVTAFDEDNVPVACVNNSLMSLSVEFLDQNIENKELIKYMDITYDKYKWNGLKGKAMKHLPIERPELFISHVERYEETPEKKLTTTILFEFKNEYDIKGKMTIEIDELIRKPTLSGSTTEKETNVKVSNNWVEPPAYYLDFDRFINYNLYLKPEYLNLTEE